MQFFMYTLASKSCWVIELIHKWKEYKGMDEYK